MLSSDKGRAGRSIVCLARSRVCTSSDGRYLYGWSVGEVTPDGAK